MCGVACLLLIAKFHNKEILINMFFAPFSVCRRHPIAATEPKICMGKYLLICSTLKMKRKKEDDNTAKKHAYVSVRVKWLAEEFRMLCTFQKANCIFCGLQVFR